MSADPACCRQHGMKVNKPDSAMLLVKYQRAVTTHPPVGGSLPNSLICACFHITGNRHRRDAHVVKADNSGQYDKLALERRARRPFVPAGTGRELMLTLNSQQESIAPVKHNCVTPSGC